jgi:UDP-N-acetylglucosamine 2-epimerase (non-hydrolysing)
MKIVHVVGARPNFMKLAPVLRAVERAGFARNRLVHTGQHYDFAMSDVFFVELGMPRPDLFLGVGSGTHAEQTAKVLVGFEKVLLEERPDLVVVAGDVNSTLACALAAAKLAIPSAHIEAGLRSFDRTMPEEINRIVTDRLAELLLTPSPDADEHLLREGTDPARIHRVGNVMIDSLAAHLPRARALGVPESMGLAPGGYAVLTLHRPANVDRPAVLAALLDAVAELAEHVPVVFPVHPRTRQRLAAAGLDARLGALAGVRVAEPQGYLEMLGLTAQAKLVLTDSGGLQEETTALGVPCLTLREETERPVTVAQGTNTLVGRDPRRIVAATREVLAGGGKAGRIPALWDGHAAGRIADVFRRFGFERGLVAA